MIDKIIGIIFVILGLFIAKIFFLPGNFSLSQKKNQNKEKLEKTIESSSERAPSGFMVGVSSNQSDDTLIQQILTETEKFEEDLLFAKNNINFIDVKTHESDEIKFRIKKAFTKYFSVIQTAPYYLEAEVFENPDEIDVEQKDVKKSGQNLKQNKVADLTNEAKLRHFIIQCSIFDREKNNKMTEFGIKIEL